MSLRSDPTDAVYERADRRFREQLGRLDLDALVEEHRRLPYGPHSDELARLLTYFRRAETAGKYVIYDDDPAGWRIGRLKDRGDEPRIDLDTASVYASSALAQQAVLEARVRSLARPDRRATMSDGDTPALYGYASSFSAAPGETITFHVSGENVREYQAQLVRLRHGYDGPGSPGFLEQERASGVDGQYAASYFRCAVGSYVEVDDPDQQLRPDAELRFGVLFYATTPELACQGLLGSWSEAEKAGYALVDRGGPPRVPGRRRRGGPAELRLAKPIQSHTWYAASAGWNGADGSAFVKLEPCGARTDRAMPAASPAEGDELRARLLQRPVPAEATPFRIGALSELAGGTRATWAHFNGKLERPWAAVTRHTRTTSAVWDFGASDQPDGLLLDAVVETGGAGLHGRTVNQPTRAVTGHNWTGRVDDYRAAPEEYGAIHLHDDDLDDPGWPPAFSFTVPEDLDSGVYAMRLRGAGCEEHVVFFVRPAAGGPRNRVAVLFPTGSYLAYANDHLPFDAAGAELLIGHVPVLHRDDLELQRHYEFGHSCYETHSDGSGVFFSSRRRPIVNMRPRYRAWFMADAFWQFPADLAIVDWLEGTGDRLGRHHRRGPPP